MGKHALQRIEPGLAYTGGKSRHRGFQHAAHAVPFRRGGENRGAHGFAPGFIQNGEMPVRERRDIGGQIVKPTVEHPAAAGNMGTDTDTLAAQGCQRYGAHRHQRRGQPPGEVPASAVVLEPMVFFMGGIIRVPRPCRHRRTSVVGAACVGVSDQHAKRRPRGFPLKHTADQLRQIFLMPCRSDPGFRSAKGQLPRNKGLIHRDTGRQTVQHGAYCCAVAFSKECHRHAAAKCILHGLLSSISRS